MPSVRRASGTRCSTSDIATIIVGAKNTPASSTAAASAGRLPTHSSGNVVNAVAAAPASNRRGSGIGSFRAPNSRPAAQLPSA
ncbi:hypothetical protein AR276_02215 [Stenotrophomonas maltophilia]|nr:hypothetical protein AR276_02215 [Stenotrophomonas maltophilia]